MHARHLLAAIAFALPAIALAEPRPAPPAATPIRIGDGTAAALRDAINVVPDDGKVFGLGQTPQAVGAVLRAAGAPADPITLSVDALLVRVGTHVVLIDTGLGPKVGGALPASLAKAGVRPDQVTDVLITHGHPDHVGGLLAADGTLAFPNAAVRMSMPEWEHLRTTGDKALVAAITPKVQAFIPGTMVLPHIASVSLPGHTPGHSGYRIGMGPTALLDIGDTAHSSIVSLVHPEWPIGYDGDKPLGRATRERLLARLAQNGERIWAPHFPYPGVGRIVKRGTGYAFVAEK